MIRYKFSIIIPVYNREKIISRCIDSFLSQNFNNSELIVVDDGSTDLTVKTINKYLDTNVKLVSYEQNRGPNYARNRGIEWANGDFILFLDSDDFLLEGSLQILNSYLNRFNKYSHFLFPVSTGKTQIQEFTREIFYKNWLFENVKGDFTHVLRAEIIKKNIFNEKYWAMEGLSWLRIIKISEPQLFINKNIVHVDNSFGDSISNRNRLNYSDKINEIFDYYFELIKVYKKDISHYKANGLVVKTIFFGIAAKRYSDNQFILKNFNLTSGQKLICNMFNDFKLSTIVKSALELNSMFRKIL